jgi:hypothetical protein
MEIVLLKEKYMELLLQIEAVGYFGVSLSQALLYKRGELTAERFALLQLGGLMPILITANINSYLSSSDLFGLVMGTIGVIVFPFVGYPIAKWVYRQFFSSN